RPLAVEAVSRLAFFVAVVWVGEVLGAQSEVDAVVLGVDRDAKRIDVVETLGPSGRNGDLFVGLGIAVGVGDQDALALGGDDQSLAVLVVGRRERHSDRRTDAAVVLPKTIGFVFDSVAVGIAQQVHVAVVAQSE